MNDEDHIKLAKIGMRFGGYMALAAASWALGGEELLRTNWLIGGVLIVVAIIFTCIGSIWERKKIEELKKNPDALKPHHDYENQTSIPINLPENNTDHHFTAFAFLSGTSLTALYFLIQSDSKNSILLTFLGVASMLFIIATIGRLNVTTRRIAKTID